MDEGVMSMKRSKYIDHTLLKADAQEGEIIRLCDEAKQHDFASVCVYSYWARTCAEQLKGTGIKQLPRQSANYRN